MKIYRYSLIGQSVETANCNRALKCIVHSSLDRYSLIEQSFIVKYSNRAFTD